MKFISKNLNDTQKLAEAFSKIIAENGVFMSLFGDIGSGKTAFVRFILKNLRVKENITSPSFVILNEYLSGTLPCYHFDLYRLEKEGLETITDELREYCEGKIATFVEWAEFSGDKTPFDKIEVKIKILENDFREFNFSAFGNKSQKILESVKI